MKLEGNIGEWKITEITLKNDGGQPLIGDIYFANDKVGWMTAGGIYQTIDGGFAWHKLANPSSSPIGLIKFFNLNDGWVSPSFFGDAMVTSDGGRTWGKVSLPKKAVVTNAFFSSLEHGCVDTKDDGLFCTFNGVDWIAVHNNLGGHLYFLDRRIGWIAGSKVHRTEDGGRTWKFQLEFQAASHSGFPGVMFADSKNGWVWRGDSILKTRNQGNDWIDVSQEWNKAIQKRFDALNLADWRP
ncbi:MAG: hypothetical protein ABI857_13645 [Acidobacteriota bacterium]